MSIAVQDLLLDTRLGFTGSTDTAASAAPAPARRHRRSRAEFRVPRHGRRSEDHSGPCLLGPLAVAPGGLAVDRVWAPRRRPRRRPRPTEEARNRPRRNRPRRKVARHLGLNGAQHQELSTTPGAGGPCGRWARRSRADRVDLGGGWIQIHKVVQVVPTECVEKPCGDIS